MIIGLTGAICAGKSEFAKYLLQTYGFEAVNLIELFKLHLQEMQAKEKEKELVTQEESKDDSCSSRTLMSRETDFCVAYYQAEYKDLREKIIKQVFKDMS